MPLKNGFKIGDCDSDEKQIDNKEIEVQNDGPVDGTAEEVPEEDEYVAPDGGWGWMVTVGLTVSMVVTMGPNSSFTIIFGDFLEATGQVGSVTTMLNSIFNISYSVACMITNPLLKNFHMRTIAIWGGILFSIPNVFCAVVDHPMEMAVLFIFEGIGLGIIFTICNTNFNEYFVKKRSMVTAISQAIAGLGFTFYPIMTETLMESYGFRGTAAIIGALSLNAIPGMSLMIPPSDWESKNSKKTPLELKETSGSKRGSLKMALSQKSSRELEILKQGDKWNSLRSLPENERITEPLLVPTVRVASDQDVEKGMTRERSKSLLVSNLQSIPRRDKSRKHLMLGGITSSSLTNLRVPSANFNESLSTAVRLRQHVAVHKATVTDDSISKVIPKVDGKTDKSIQTEDTGISAWFSRQFQDLIDYSLLKDPAFLNMSFATSLAMTSDFTFTSLLPIIMTANGYTKSDAAFAVTASAGAELVARVCLAIFTIFIDVRPKIIFFIAIVLMTLAKTGFMYAENITEALVMSGLIGMVRSMIFVTQPLVVIEDVRVDQFAAAYGVYGIISGVIAVVGGPLAGFITDWTDSFKWCQLTLIVMNALFIVPWGIEILCMSRRTENTRRSGNS